jgi:hypothetical protein
MEFHENPSAGSRDIPGKQTDDKTDEYEMASSRFSQSS